MNRIRNIISTINDVYAIKNNNYNAVMNRIDDILSHKNNKISEQQIVNINKILLDNNKQINESTMIKILELLNDNQQIDIDHQLTFLLDMKA